MDDAITQTGMSFDWYRVTHKNMKILKVSTILSHIGFGIFNYILMFTSALTMASFIIEMIGISFIFPVSGCDLHLTHTQKGILGAAGYFGIICSSHLWGYLGIKPFEERKYISVIHK